MTRHDRRLLLAPAMKPSALLTLLLATVAVAHADPINISLVNQSGTPIDYSLQLANFHIRSVWDQVPELLNRVYAGKERADQVSAQAILDVGQVSPNLVYQLAVTTLGYSASDTVSLNIETPAGQAYGMHFQRVAPPTCTIPKLAAYGAALLTLTNDPDVPSRLRLTEVLPQGWQCTFELDPGLGPGLW